MAGMAGSYLSGRAAVPCCPRMATFTAAETRDAQGPLRLAIGFAGADRLLAGSDYPHQIGSIPLMREAISALFGL